MNTNNKTVNLDDELFEPISYFGKENTRRIKRAHEIRPKKYPNTGSTKTQQSNNLYDSDKIKTRSQSKQIEIQEKKKRK